MKQFVNRKVLGARDHWIELALGLAAFALYFRTMPPTVLDGDSGEFQYMAYILGVPHSSGYPLYILIGKIFTLLPIGDVAYRVNLFSVVCAALAMPIVYALARRLLPRRAPALLATLTFAVIPSVWGGALETKPYAFHLLLGVLALFLAVRWNRDASVRDLYWCAFVFGLGLTNHLIIAFIAPALALIVWFNRARLNRTMIARCILLTLLPLLLYAYIPIRANQLIAQQDPQNWALYPREDAMVKGTVTAYYNNTVKGFFELVTGLGNSYKFGFESSVEESNRVNNAVRLLWQQFGVGLVLVAAGAAVSFWRDRKMFALVAAVAIGVGFIGVYLRAAISTIYYFSLCYLALALWLGFGIDALMQGAARAGVIASEAKQSPSWVEIASSRKSLLAMTYQIVVVLIALALSLGLLFSNFARLDESQNYAARDYAQAVLGDNLAPNAVVIAPQEVSEPIRYFQFVEHQRPDLLVTNVPPIWPQFERMMTRARELSRPFYNVEFYPEFRTASGPRSVQAVPLPLLQEPRPRYTFRDARIVPETQVIGYDLDPDPPQSGKPLRVLVYYRTLARMYPMYSSLLSVNDSAGKLIGDYEGFPGSYFFPTYRWQAGDYYRSAWTINLSADALAGLYNLDLYWYVYDLDTHKADYSREVHTALGAIRVGDFGAAQIEHARTARVGDAISLLGWNGASLVARGQVLPLDLIWRAERAVSESYTVFVHLVDAEGRVVADADSPPFSGLFTTDRWQVGEALRDRHTLKIPSDLAPGNYAVEIGMYLPVTGARLPIDGAADKIILTQVSVR